jgi:DNA repair exonuclease SbcCD ATPase subunit
MTESSILIVTSMHRSGSSLVASLLQSAGLHIGRQLMQPNEGNIKGYFENLDFCKFHLDLLESQGIDRDGWTLQEKIEVEDRFVDIAKELVDQNSLSRYWGWKDPRTTLFLDFWGELLPEANFLLVYRSPWEVVDSLYRRGDAFFLDKPELAVKMWLHYNQKILHFYNRFSSRCLLASLNTLISHQEKYIEVINQKFQTKLVAPESSISDPSLLYTQGLDNYRPTLLNHYFPEAIQMYQELDARTRQPDGVSNFQWRESIKPSLYRFWPFQDWRNMRVLGAENKHLRSTLEGSQAQLQQTQVEREQLQVQLHQTEEVLEQSQTQLQQAQAELEQSRSHLQQTEVVLEQSQAQLHQTEEVLEQSQTQLQQAQVELEQSRSHLQQTEVVLEQSQAQLHQTQAERSQFQAQLHQTEEVLEQSQTQLQQAQAELEQSRSHLQQTEVVLEQSQAQLHQTEEMLGQYHIQLKQTEEILEQSQSLLQEAKGESDRKHKMEKLEKSTQLQQNPASNPISQKNVQYELLVWDAWDAYQSGNLNAMHECLESSLRWSHSLRTENPVKWLERFKELSSEEGISIDIQTLTSTNEWRQLMQRVMTANRA